MKQSQAMDSMPPEGYQEPEILPGHKTRFRPGQSGNLLGRMPSHPTDADRVRMLRSAVVGLIRSGSAQFARDIQSLKPKDRIQLLMQLLRLVLPKPRPVPIEEDNGDAADATADLLRSVYSRLESEEDESEPAQPSSVDSLLRSMRSRYD